MLDIVLPVIAVPGGIELVQFEGLVGERLEIEGLVDFREASSAQQTHQLVTLLEQRKVHAAVLRVRTPVRRTMVRRWLT
jgi:hypothetical protein